MGYGRTIGITTALILFLAGSASVSPHAEERTRTIRINSTASSSFYTASFSFDGKAPANQAIYAGEGNWGKFTGQGISQSDFTNISCFLPDGTGGVETHLVGHIASTRFEASGDLLFERGSKDSLIACIDPVTLVFHEEGTVDIIGGTGGFEGAKGTETVRVDGRLLALPALPANNRFAGSAFGVSTGTFRMKFTVPSRHD